MAPPPPPQQQSSANTLLGLLAAAATQWAIMGALAYSDGTFIPAEALPFTTAILSVLQIAVLVFAAIEADIASPGRAEGSLHRGPVGVQRRDGVCHPVDRVGEQPPPDLLVLGRAVRRVTAGGHDFRLHVRRGCICVFCVGSGAPGLR